MTFSRENFQEYQMLCVKILSQAKMGFHQYFIRQFQAGISHLDIYYVDYIGVLVVYKHLHLLLHIVNTNFVFLEVYLMYLVNILRTIYFALLQSHISYGLEVYIIATK